MDGSALCSIAECNKRTLARGWCRTHYTRWYETGSTELGVRTGEGRHKVKPLRQRFLAKVDKSGDCWLWTGAKTNLGYGCVWSGPGGSQVLAHRVSWELHRGPIPAGLQIDHICRVPSCVRPEHLEPVSPSVNTARGYAPSLGAAFQLAKTHCPQEHPYDAVNTYINKRGGRMCKTCIWEGTGPVERPRKRECRMWTRTFALGALERAAKTVAQTLLSLFLVGDVAFNVIEFRWLPSLGIAGGAFVISLLTSLLSVGVGPVGSPSLVGEPGRHAAP